MIVTIFDDPASFWHDLMHFFAMFCFDLMGFMAWIGLEERP